MLRFYAVKGHLCPLPGVNQPGMVHSYFGRVPLIADGRASFPASLEPTAVQPGSDFARRAVKFAQRGALAPADAETAKACGLPFVELERDGDEWAPRGSKPEQGKRKGGE